MKNVRLFETTSAYESAKLDYPNLSLIEDGNKVKSVLEDPYVDLGLSVKWMKCNTGAEEETDYGLFFQWGDTVGYDEDSSAAHSTWPTCPGNGGAISADTSALSTWNETNLTNGVLNTVADVAYIHTNGKAKMPTKAHLEELISGTNNEWTTINGVAGYKFTNKTDASKYIFIPAAGYFDYGPRYGKGSSGYVWSSSLRDSTVERAYCLGFISGRVGTGHSGRCYAQCVRGVLV
jgi:hypothetical protein